MDNLTANSSSINTTDVFYAKLSYKVLDDSYEVSLTGKDFYRYFWGSFDTQEFSGINKEIALVYHVFKKTLQKLIESNLQTQNIILISPSILLVNQIEGVWMPLHDSPYKSLYNECKEGLKQFKNIQLVYLAESKKPNRLKNV